MTNDDVVAVIKEVLPVVELSPEAKARIWQRFLDKLKDSLLDVSTWICEHCDSGNIGSRCWCCKKPRR